MKKLIILGGGTAGTMMAHHLVGKLPGGWEVTLIDPEQDHYYQPGYLFIPFGIYSHDDIRKPRGSLLPREVIWVREAAAQILPEDRAIELADGSRLSYDLLIIATGSRIVPDEMEGIQGGWRRNIFDFYSSEGALALKPALDAFAGGQLVVHIQEMPIKCPVAPLEFAFLADYHLSLRGIREKTQITFVTPLDGAFTKPVAAKALSHLLGEKGISVVADYNVERVDTERNCLISYDGREVPYDLLVTVPTNMGDPIIDNSGMGDELGFVSVDRNTLQHPEHPEVFVVGDATDVPTSKAGSVAHFEGEILVANILHFIKGQELTARFDGHANCFIESGYRKGLLIDFNYDQEPVPGRFPYGNIGPLALLEENRINHMGKMAFKWVYWNLILKARKIPGVTAKMKLKGKRLPST